MSLDSFKRDGADFGTRRIVQRDRGIMFSPIERYADMTTCESAQHSGNNEWKRPLVAVDNLYRDAEAGCYGRVRVQTLRADLAEDRAIRIID